MATAHFQAIGTEWSIAVHDNAITGHDWDELLARVQQRISEFDRAYSRFRADSLVTKMAKRAGRYQLPPDGHALLRTYEKLYAATKGQVTPLIGQLVADAGYDATYSLQPKTLASPPRWEDVLSYDRQSITLLRPALLDFGAAGKGYLVDIIGELLETAGAQHYHINAGGDIRCRSKTTEGLTAALENPFDTTEAVGTVTLHNQSLCASSGAKRRWSTYHHIISPTTLSSPNQVVATWAIAKDTLTADGVATALFFTDSAQLGKYFSFAGAQLYQDMSLHYTANFPVHTFEEAA